MKQFARRSRKEGTESRITGTNDQDQLVISSQDPLVIDPFEFPSDEGLVPATVAAVPTGTKSIVNKAPAAAQQRALASTKPAQAGQHQKKLSDFECDSQQLNCSPPKRARVATDSSKHRVYFTKSTATTAGRKQQAAPTSQSQPPPAAFGGHRPEAANAVTNAAAAAAAPTTTAVGAKRRAPSCDPPRPTAAPTAVPEKSAVLAKDAAAAVNGRGVASGPASGINRRPAGLKSRGPSSGRGATAAGSGRSRAASRSGCAASGGCATAGPIRPASGSSRQAKSASGDIAQALQSAGLPGTSAGSQEQQVPGAATSRQPGNNTPAVSLPTLRRPVGLIAAAGLLAAAEGRPALTVMEAQERGELVQLQDDARYAMDGLAAGCSIDTQRESTVALTEMLCSHRGRMALRSDGLAQQVLSCLAKLKACKDCVMSLAATIVLLMLTSEDAHPAYLASVAAAVLTDQLLQSNHSLDDASSCGTSGAKLAKLLRARPLFTLLTSTGASTQRELLLITLEQATSSQQTSKVAAVEKLKHNLRQYGVLQRLGKLVAAAAGNAVQEARQLHLLLLVLENATFTCQPNGQVLVALKVPADSNNIATALNGDTTTENVSPGDKQQQQQQPFPAVLVSAAQQLLGNLADAQCQQALHVCLSVLMNLSHQNPEGAAVIIEAGGLQAATATIQQLLRPVQQETHQALCKQILQHLELISVALGVLINLVSGEPGNSKTLAGLGGAAALAAEDEQSSSMDCDTSSQGQPQGLVALLCAVMKAVGRLLEQQQEEVLQAQHEQDASRHHCRRGAADKAGKAGTSAGAMASSDSPTASQSAGDVDGAAGLDTNSASEASIVEVYCGMLLGFLVRDCAEIAEAVAAQLEGGSLQPIVCAVQRCLNFYVSTGAITEHTRCTLEELLQHLSSRTQEGSAVAPAGVACT